MAIGRDLLDVPFAELVRNLAVAIADGQTALDRNSLSRRSRRSPRSRWRCSPTSPRSSSDDDPADRDGPGREWHPQQRDGAGQRRAGAPVGRRAHHDVDVAGGAVPTFYQFTEASVEVKIARSRCTRTDPHEHRVGARVPRARRLARVRVQCGRPDAEHVHLRRHGVQRAARHVRPVPPPSRLQPAITTVNTLTDPPTVTTVLPETTGDPRTTQLVYQLGESALGAVGAAPRPRLGGGIGQAQAALDRHSIEIQELIDVILLLGQFGVAVDAVRDLRTQLDVKIAVAMAQPAGTTPGIYLLFVPGGPLLEPRRAHQCR